MKKFLLLSSVFLFLVSCSNDDSNNNDSQGVNQSKIFGYWYKGLGAPFYYYDYYYFGEDGEYQQGWGPINSNPLTGTWEWEDGTTIKITPSPGGGIAGGVQTHEFRKISNDSLCSASDEGLKYSRTNHND
ncbi:hypothetical protein [Flavobacterium orientale]|uniref:Lipocalin-like domain-containing protein n=1 Tax=Flavobacterium orientale TaxID=1756020 RepID=A0A916XZK1_9FLAO|nr:hypothetical protein [Flavobacterium orientale]GGD22368.1 hypothetical protein GCM10011343_10720 [Flavobacterium orientale]